MNDDESKTPDAGADNLQDVASGQHYIRAGDTAHIWEIAHIAPAKDGGVPQVIIYRIDRPIPPEVVPLSAFDDLEAFTPIVEGVVH